MQYKLIIKIHYYQYMISINKQLINVFSDLIPIGETLQYVQTKENVSTRQVSCQCQWLLWVHLNTMRKIHPFKC